MLSNGTVQKSRVFLQYSQAVKCKMMVKISLSHTGC